MALDVAAVPDQLDREFVCFWCSEKYKLKKTKKKTNIGLRTTSAEIERDDILLLMKKSTSPSRLDGSAWAESESLSACMR